MKSLQLRAILTVAAGALLLAACDSSAATGSTSSSTSSSASSTSSSSSSTAAATTVRSATVNVKGTSETVLTDSVGKTLYYRKTDTATSVYSGTTWPALTLDSGTPTGPASVTGTLSTTTNANGRQVTYNGHAVYRYAPDAPGEAGGQGLGNVWFVVTPDLSHM